MTTSADTDNFIFLRVTNGADDRKFQTCFTVLNQRGSNLICSIKIILLTLQTSGIFGQIMIEWENPI